MTHIPLAERMRPKSIEEYVGQQHLLGPDAALRASIMQDNIPSIILWGPPGVGKTTLAQCIAKEISRPFYALSAINSGVKDVRETIKKAESQRFFDRGGAILFIDEIHRFSKSQQDSLLGAVEKGVITLIGATTENPSFEVISALLSRCQVYVLKPLSKTDLKIILDRAIKRDDLLNKKDIKIDEYEALYKYSGGDARRLLNILDLVSGHLDHETPAITDDLVSSVVQSDPLAYDKMGEHHYDTISAFIKSVRGSNADAAVYYLARMIEGGEDPKFICRRMIILASEDIGLANPNALLIANACFDAVQKIGLPEGRIPMAQAAIYLATSPKSNSAYMAIGASIAEVRSNGHLPIPLHLRNAPTDLMKELDYGKDYVYTHESEEPKDYHYLPKAIKGSRFYTPKDIGSEKKIYDRAQKIKPHKD
jgi:ATPase related to the helicase subunit of the Holliday junction resolvase